MDAAAAAIDAALWEVGIVTVPSGGYLCLHALKEAGFVVLPEDRIKRLSVTRAVDKMMLHAAVTNITDFITRDLGTRLGRGLVDVVPVKQRDLEGEWPGSPTVEFSAQVDVILPTEVQ